MRLAGLTLQLPATHTVKLHLLSHRPSTGNCFLLISLLFACSRFVDVSLNQQTSVSATGKEVSKRIHLPAQAVSEEPLQTLQAVKILTDRI